MAVLTKSWTIAKNTCGVINLVHLLVCNWEVKGVFTIFCGSALTQKTFKCTRFGVF